MKERSGLQREVKCAEGERSRSKRLKAQSEGEVNVNKRALNARQTASRSSGESEVILRHSLVLISPKTRRPY